MMRHKWRVYLKFFKDDGSYEDDWTEITDDVEFDRLGSIEKGLDNTEYDIGVYRSNSVAVTLRNEHGKYSDVGSQNTLFRYKRSGTLVKFTWELTEEQAICGVARANNCWLSNEETLFIGLLNDETTEMDVHQQNINFKVLGREAVFQKTVVPFADISNGDTIDEILYAILNQDMITDLVGVDPININSGNNQAVDVVASLENKTVQEALSELLLLANSVIYINDDGDLVVSSRDASADVMNTFYGQNSTLGSEDIQSLDKVKTGIARTFNFFTYGDTTLFAEDASSREKYGTRKKEIGSDLFTNPTKKQNVINALRTEFGQPKQELQLITPFNYNTQPLVLLDKVTIDYPTVYILGTLGFESLPICGAAVCGEGRLPKALYDFIITTETEFKILSKSIDTKTGLVTFQLREV